MPPDITNTRLPRHVIYVVFSLTHHPWESGGHSLVYLLNFLLFNSTPSQKLRGSLPSQNVNQNGCVSYDKTSDQKCDIRKKVIYLQHRERQIPRYGLKLVESGFAPSAQPLRSIWEGEGEFKIVYGTEFETTSMASSAKLTVVGSVD